MELICQILPFYLLHFCLGVSLGFPSILLEQLYDDDINLDKSGKGWIVSLDYLMTGVLALVAGHLQAKYGPKKISMLSCIPTCVSWALMAAATDLPIIYLSRMLVGCGNGILLCSIYTIEVAPARLRGTVVMGEMVFRNLGMMVIFLVADFLPWGTIAACVIPIPFLSMLILMLVPESPIFLATHHGYVNPDHEDTDDDVKSVLETTEAASSTQLHDGPASLVENTQNHYHAILASIQSWWKDFERQEVSSPAILLILVIFAQECSASKVIQGHAVEIFETIHKKNAVGGDPYTSSVIMTCIRLISTLVSAKLINNFGRKTMYSLSACLTIIFEILFGCNHWFDWASLWKSLPILLIYAQVCCLQIGLETFPQLLSGELFPNDVRSKGRGVIRAISSLASFVMLTLFPIIQDTLGFHVSLLIFAFFLLLIVPIILWFLPEVKDVDLDAIPGFFGNVSTIFYLDLEILENDEDKQDALLIKDLIGNKIRIQMIDNCFGIFGKQLTNESRTILAEGFLFHSRNVEPKKTKQHFFLFSDLLVWGSVICENRNYFGQKIISMQEVTLEDIPATNAWIVSTETLKFTLEADDLHNKMDWMKTMQYSISQSKKHLIPKINL